MTRTVIALAFCVVATTTSVAAVVIEKHERSSVPSNSRFELVQSTLAAKLTLRVDKFTGRVDQLVEVSAGGKTWQPIPRGKHVSDTTNPNVVNYQVFTSGMAVKFTFMINVHTGATWQLIASKDGPVWDPII